MKRALSIISIIFLLGVTTAMPYFSCSFSVYAESDEPTMTNSEIIDFAIETFLNTKNGFILAAQGGRDAVKSVMKVYRKTYYAMDNNHFTDDTLAGILLVKYNPLRIQIPGTAVKFFNDFYDYLVDTGKLPNAENSNGGTTTDNLYNGKMINGQLFTVLNNADFNNASLGGTIELSPSNVTLGNAADATTAQVLTQTFSSKYPNYNFSSNTGNPSGSASYTITFTANYSVTGYIMSNKNAFNNNITANYSPSIRWGGMAGDTSSSDYLLNYCGNLIYCNRVNHLEGFPAYFIVNPPNDVQYLAYGMITQDFTNNKFYAVKWRNFDPVDSNNTTQANVNFVTDDFESAPIQEPEEGQSVQLTPRNKTNNETFNTYNEYINNYNNKNTKIVKKIITTGDSGEDDPTNPTNPTNPSDPSQPTTQNPYPLDPTDPSAPTGGTIPDWTTPSGNGGSGTITPDGNGGYTFELPDFSLPDLDINWSISGLAEKFPFSIPFDLLAFFTVLNAEPQTPAIQATIPLGIWEWEIDWDLHDFDNLAGLLRNLEFIGFCIGLALITRNIIKG